MRFAFYPKLAWEGVRKNKRLYFPYILSGSIMVMMYYILSFLIESPALAQMPGGSVLMSVLLLGCVVIAFFSLLFLFYTNSFLIKQRYREFGLYNILGMDKHNISKIMVWETLFVAVFAIGSGLIAGIIFSKMAELVLLNLLNMEADFTLSIGVISLRQTPLIYGGIYLLLLLNSLIKVSRSKPLELMQSSKVGERIPKRNWIYGAAGVVLLAVAYYLAVSIEEPLAALANFFLAVIMVIIGTYLVFMSGSVVFCKLLQKNKKYYYKPNHFVSVSSMVYRMKRNGAGLASICILLTMVLVMISSTTSLYFGEEDSLKNRCPNDVNITITFDTMEGISDANLNMLRDSIRQYSGEDAELKGVRACEIPGLITQEGITIDTNSHVNFSASTYNNVGYLSVISIDDYNLMMGTNDTLVDDECFVYCDRLNYQWDTFTMEYGATYRVKKQLDNFQVDGDASAMIIPTVYLVVNDIYVFSEPVKDMKNGNGDPMMMYDWRCGFDVDSVDIEREISTNLNGMFRNLYIENNDAFYSYSVQSREVMRESFYDVYGSLFFLGIMLSIVFLLAAVLIIYYKQISEGYEDHGKFEIMQKVGMTKKDIRKSINSQMLTVFFMPLIFAGIHLIFAFPFISKILMLFSMDNMVLTAIANLTCFAVFGVFYALVYKITSNAYYAIVSGAKEV